MKKIFFLLIVLASTETHALAQVSVGGGGTLTLVPAGCSTCVLNADGSLNTAVLNPLTSITMNPTTGVLSGTVASGATTPANTNGGTFATSPSPLTATVAATTGGVTMTKADGTAITTGVVNPLALPSYAPAQAIVTGNTYQLATGYAIYPLTSGIAVLAVTIKLPASPIDRQTARIACNAAITGVTVQDASGSAVQSSLGLGAGADMLFQYQATSWVRIGS